MAAAPIPPFFSFFFFNRRFYWLIIWIFKFWLAVCIVRNIPYHALVKHFRKIPKFNRLLQLKNEIYAVIGNTFGRHFFLLFNCIYFISFYYYCPGIAPELPRNCPGKWETDWTLMGIQLKLNWLTWFVDDDGVMFWLFLNKKVEWFEEAF